MQQRSRRVMVVLMVAMVATLWGTCLAIAQEGNIAPVADAGEDQQVFLRPGQMTIDVTLDASGSHDPDGREWRLRAARAGKPRHHCHPAITQHTVRVNNTKPEDADMLENDGSKTQALQADADNTVITSDKYLSKSNVIF
jgi:hypothetical protein